MSARGAIIALIAVVAFATGARATTLDELTTSQRLTLGPLVLSNFTVSSADGIDPATIEVEPEAFVNAEGTPLLGVRFSRPVALASSATAARSVACAIAFDVALDDTELTLAGLTHTTLGVVNGSGAVLNETVVLPAGVTTVSSVTPVTEERSCLASGPCVDYPWTTDSMELFAPSSAVHVRQTLAMAAGDRADAGTARLDHFEVLFWLAPRR
jgi:hypothetical protein